jgi:hypothetical protein
MKPMIRRLQLLERACQVEVYVEDEVSPTAVIRGATAKAIADGRWGRSRTKATYSVFARHDVWCPGQIGTTNSWRRN